MVIHTQKTVIHTQGVVIHTQGMVIRPSDGYSQARECEHETNVRIIFTSRGFQPTTRFAFGICSQAYVLSTQCLMHKVLFGAVTRIYSREVGVDLWSKGVGSQSEGVELPSEGVDLQPEGLTCSTGGAVTTVATVTVEPWPSLLQRNRPQSLSSSLYSAFRSRRPSSDTHHVPPKAPCEKEATSLDNNNLKQVGRVGWHVGLYVLPGTFQQ
jgi:hypothetical protein